MAFDDKTRRTLFKTVTACRNLLTEDFDEQLRGRFGIYADEGRVLELARLTSLSDAERETARILRERIDHLAAGKGKQGITDAVHRIRREQAFTVLNRFAALRMAEDRGVIRPSVGGGFSSTGFQIFERAAGGEHSAAAAFGSQYDRYLVYLDCLFDELSLDLGVLFDRTDAMGLLFPSESGLRDLFTELNSPNVAHLWGEDETIGWIYQYYNDPAERKKMRDESAAPRNSREMAVRNQFFTPRYVVEFLTDNSLGQLWYEMTKGKTSLKDRCRYMIRRPLDVFLVTPTFENFTLEKDDWVSEVALSANFSRLPENPPIEELARFALLIEGYELIETIEPSREGQQEAISRFIERVCNPQLEASENGPQPWQGTAVELWCALFIIQRKRWRECWLNGGNGKSYEDACASDDFAARDLWPALRHALQHTPENLSQEEQLRQPAFIAHRPLKDPREIRIIDPACGSMHFGLYAFDLLEVIYQESRGFSVLGTSLPPLYILYKSNEEFRRDIPRLIIEHNIHGVDIDPRATQIAGLSLWLRAQRAWAEQGIPTVQRPVVRRSQIVCAEPMPGEKELLREFVEQEFPLGERAVLLPLLESVFDLMQLAGEAGSLLQIEEDIRSTIAEAKLRWKATPRTEQITLFDEEANPAPAQEEMARDLSGITDEEFWEKAEERIYDSLRTFAESASGGYQRRLFAEDAARGFAFIDLCRQRYDVALMNPPFGDGSLPSKSYIDETYGDTKGDVYKAFVECFQARLVPAGYLGIISSRTGFFLGLSEDWRTRVVLRLFRPIALADLGSGVLDAMVEVAAYVLRNLSASEARDLTLSLVPVLEKVVRDKQDRFSLPKWQAARDGLKRHQAIAELEHLEFHGFVQRSPGDMVRYTPLWHSVKKVTSLPKPVFPPLVCVRALEDQDKEKSVLSSIKTIDGRNTFLTRPSDFLHVTGAPFSYWVSPAIRRLFRELPEFESDERIVRQGLATADDFRFIRAVWEVAETTKRSRWFPLVKGGKFSPFYADTPVSVSWMDHGRELKAWIETLPGCAHWSRRIANAEHYFRPGLTWPLRAKAFSPQVMPKGCVFSVRGYSILAPEAELASLLGLTASSTFDYLFKILLGRFGFPEFVVGVLQKLPLPLIRNEFAQALASHAREAWVAKRDVDTADSTSHAFFLPALLASPGDILAEGTAAWAARVRTSEQTVAAIQTKIDDIAFRLYGLDEADRVALTSTIATEANSDDEPGEDEEEEVVTADAPVLTADLLAYVLGCAFGRWDIRYANGGRAAPEPPDPFDPLPVCSPGMLQNAAGLPATPADVPASYPVPITWSGILVDDANHSEDVVTRVRGVTEVIWTDRAEAIEAEACEILQVKAKPKEDLDALRVYFRDPNRFFKSHLARYSKSRRKAPIYWPISTDSGSYTLWIYYHRLNRQTLFTCIEMIDRKREDLGRDTEALRSRGGTDGTAEERQKIEDQAAFLAELKTLRDRLLEVTNLPYHPNLNDGVQITAAPLWQCFRHGPWQKVLKETWSELTKGEYDWAHLAMSIWPDRVVPKCTKDLSLAITHGIDNLLWVPDLASKKKDQYRPLKSPDEELKHLKQAGHSKDDLEKAAQEVTAAEISGLRTHLWIEQPPGTWRRRKSPKEEIENEIARRRGDS